MKASRSGQCEPLGSKARRASRVVPLSISLFAASLSQCEDTFMVEVKDSATLASTVGRDSEKRAKSILTYKTDNGCV